MNKKLLITVLIAIFLIGATFLAINFAKGYRIDLKKRKVAETGLLVVNSFPTGASVFINDKLTTATNDTLNLPPGDYKVKIVKDGYISWEKALKLNKELVTQANARLFPAVPDLKSLTNSGAENINPSPDGTKIAYAVASASATLKNGLYVYDLTDKALSFTRGARQIARNGPDFNFTQVNLVWSPDSKQLLAINSENSYLLDINRLNEITTKGDVSARLPIILSEWEEELKLKKEEQLKIKNLPDFMTQVASESAKQVFFSPDEDMVLYTATASATLPEGLMPQLPSTSTQPQTRMIEPNNIYIYHIKEDKNFFILKAPETKKEEEKKQTKLEIRLENLKNQYTPLNLQNIQWFPTSQHLVLVENDKIIILEYDGTNKTTVYAGPFTNNFAYPYPDGSKIIILTTLNPDSPLPPNLYTIDLK